MWSLAVRRIGAGSTWLSFNRLTTLSTARTRKLPSLVKMSLADSENFKRLASSEDVIALKDLFAKHNFELRLAGGAVRDLLAGYDAPHDLDFATTATPEQMRRFLIDEGVRWAHCLTLTLLKQSRSCEKKYI